MAKSINPSSTTVPAGPQHAVVFAVNDLGEQPRYQEDGTTWQYAVGLEFPAVLGNNGKPRTQWLCVDQSLHPKSKLGKLIAATNIKLPHDEPFDPENLIGKNITAILEAVERNGNTYADITGFTKVSATVTPSSPLNPPTTLMPDWLREKQHNRLDQTAAPVAGW